MLLPLLLLVAAALLPPAARAQQVRTTYQCDLVDVNNCALERAQCLAFPRPWRRGYDADFACSCWAQSYLCYQDCDGRFPPDFSAQCSAVCPASVCAPALGWAHP
jgi:hypothetical protein